jgi:acyl-CoA hydrolase
MPRVPGAAVVRCTDCVVVPTDQRETDEFIPLSHDFDETDIGAARHVLPWLPARPTVALGMGRISDALAGFLREVDGLRITSGVITESARALGGLVAEPMRAMSVIGAPPLLDWAARSGMVQLLPSTFIHAPDWLSRRRRFVAVLSALQVDASGAANSEQLGARLVSGVGGSVDLAAGAHASPGGLTILALRAQDPKGRSTLVAELARTTIPAVLVDVIATEHGAVRVTGLAADARRRALASIF